MEGTRLVVRDYVRFCQILADKRFGRAAGRHGSGRDVENYIAFHVANRDEAKIDGVICDREGRVVFFTAHPAHLSGAVSIKVEAGRAGWGGGLTRLSATQKIARLLQKAVNNSLNERKNSGMNKSTWDGYYLENTRLNSPVSEKDIACFEKAEREGFMPKEFVMACIKWNIRAYEQFKKVKLAS